VCVKKPTFFRHPLRFSPDVCKLPEAFLGCLPGNGLKKTYKPAGQIVKKRTGSAKKGGHLKICINIGNNERKVVLFKETNLSILYDSLLTRKKKCALMLAEGLNEQPENESRKLRKIV